MKGIGYCLKNCKPEEVRKGIKWLEKKNFAKQELAILKDIFEEKKHSPYDLGYWVDYVFKFGTEHLNPHYS